jgi:hypothetical protein
MPDATATLSQEDAAAALAVEGLRLAYQYSDALTYARFFYTYSWFLGPLLVWILSCMFRTAAFCFVNRCGLALHRAVFNTFTLLGLLGAITIATLLFVAIYGMT